MASKFKNSPTANLIAMIILALIPIALWIVPAGQFDDTGVVLCPSRFLFDIECPGCGITRAILHFHHWDFDEAVYHNMFVLIIYPLLFLLWLYWMYHILINLGWIKKRGSDKV